MDPDKTAALAKLYQALLAAEHRQSDEHRWPEEQWNVCRQFGYFRWIAPRDWNGDGWSEADILAAYLALARASLTTAFILTQRAGAVDRIQRFAPRELQQRLLPELVQGDALATIGISHLTTSRQHLREPALLATPQHGGYLLRGETPWVTGAVRADWLVIGAATADGQQLLLAVETTREGVEPEAPLMLTGLTGSLTGAVRFNQVWLPGDHVIAGPSPDVMSSGGGRTGGLSTSALALGHARQAVDFVENEARQRPELEEVAAGLQMQYKELEGMLMSLAVKATDGGNDELRRRANDFVLRATNAAMVAAKGAGFVSHHPVSRWCREALFFLVWSCPQKVLLGNLRHWAC